jgi:hypothetical protein
MYQVLVDPSTALPLVGRAGLVRMSRTHSAGFDEFGMIHSRFALGYVKSIDNRRGTPGNQDSGILSEDAFHHSGFGGSIGFADPRADLALGYVMNKQGQGNCSARAAEPNRRRVPVDQYGGRGALVRVSREAVASRDCPRARLDAARKRCLLPSWGGVRRGTRLRRLVRILILLGAALFWMGPPKPFRRAVPARGRRGLYRRRSTRHAV